MGVKKKIYGITISILILIAFWSYFSRQNQWFILSVGLAFAFAFFKKQFYKLLKLLGL